MEVLPAPGCTGLRELSCAVRQGGWLSDRAAIHERERSVQGLGRPRQHHAANIRSVQDAEVRVPYHKWHGDRDQRTLLRRARDLHQYLAHLRGGGEAAREGA